MAEREARTTWEAGPIKDARGKLVTQLDPVVMHLTHQHALIPAAPLKEIAQEVGIGMTRANRIAFWGGLVGLFAFLFAITIHSVRLLNGSIQFGEFARNLVPFCGIWVAPYAFWMGSRGVRFQRITSIMLKHRRCPHCGYDLRALPVDDNDGASLCPECGSAWIVPDVEVDGTDG